MPQTPVATPPREAAEGEMPKLAHQKKGTSTNTQLREYMIREVDHFRRPIGILRTPWDVGLPTALQIQHTMDNGDPTNPISDHNGLLVSHNTFQRLRWPATTTDHWLDTSIIDTYLSHVSTFAPPWTATAPATCHDPSQRESYYTAHSST